MSSYLGRETDTSHTIRDKKKLHARVSRIQGQALALRKMIENETDCTAVLQQIAALRGAVNGLMLAVMEGHLTEHVVHQTSNEKREDDIEIVLKMLRSYMK